MDNRIVVIAHTVGIDYVKKYKKKLGKVGDNLDKIAWRAMVVKV